MYGFIRGQTGIRLLHSYLLRLHRCLHSTLLAPVASTAALLFQALESSGWIPGDESTAVSDGPIDFHGLSRCQTRCGEEIEWWPSGEAKGRERERHDRDDIVDSNVGKREGRLDESFAQRADDPSCASCW